MVETKHSPRLVESLKRLAEALSKRPPELRYLDIAKFNPNGVPPFTVLP